MIDHYCSGCKKYFLGDSEAACPNCWGDPMLAKPDMEATLDRVNHPPHYLNHPSGVECIQITEHMNFCLGNAIKYIWRAGQKGTPKTELEDLRKAAWYVNREIARLVDAKR